MGSIQSGAEVIAAPPSASRRSTWRLLRSLTGMVVTSKTALGSGLKALGLPLLLTPYPLPLTPYPYTFVHRLRPIGFSRRGSDHDALQEGDRLLQSFVAR